MGSEDLKKRIAELGGSKGFRAELAAVVAVDGSRKTCTVKLLSSDLEIVGVRLTADIKEDDGNYFVNHPTVGSNVVVARLKNGFWFVLIYGDIDLTEISRGDVTIKVSEKEVDITANGVNFNGGDKGGLVNLEELSKILKAINSFLTAFKTAVNTPVATASPGSPDLFQMAVQAALSAQKVEAVTESLEDKKVKH